MRRIPFYTLLSVQFIIIVFLVIQFEQIDTKGRTITLKTIKSYDYLDYQSYDGFLYVEYEANKIKSDLLHPAKSLEWGDRVYALLKGDADHVYTVKQASTKKLTATSDDEIVLIGTYQYEDEYKKFKYVDFELGEIKHIEQFGSFNNRKPLLVTLKIGKWGQHKVISIKESD